jgi:hypothetical protein
VCFLGFRQVRFTSTGLYLIVLCERNPVSQITASLLDNQIRSCQICQWNGDSAAHLLKAYHPHKSSVSLSFNPSREQPKHDVRIVRQVGPQPWYVYTARSFLANEVFLYDPVLLNHSYSIFEVLCWQLVYCIQSCRSIIDVTLPRFFKVSCSSGSFKLLKCHLVLNYRKMLYDRLASTKARTFRNTFLSISGSRLTTPTTPCFSGLARATRSAVPGQRNIIEPSFGCAAF